MNGIKYALIFAAGAVLGAVSAVAMVKEKYESLAQIEIETIRRYYKEKMKKEDKNELQEESKLKQEYEDISNNYKGDIVGEKPFVIKEDGEVIDPYDTPYIISVEEFGEDIEYDTMTLTYFEDKVLVDDVDDVIEDVDTVVGLENLKIFEEFPGCTTIYVRNDIWKTDFEIIKDDWKWSDFQESEDKLLKKIQDTKKPHQL